MASSALSHSFIQDYRTQHATQLEVVSTRPLPRINRCSAKRWWVGVGFALCIILFGGGAWLTSSVKHYAHHLNIFYGPTVQDWSQKGLSLSIKSLSWRVTSTFPFMGIAFQDVRMQCVVPQKDRSPYVFELNAPEVYGHVKVSWQRNFQLSLKIHTLDFRSPQVLCLFQTDSSPQKYIHDLQNHIQHVVGEHVHGFALPRLQVSKGTLVCKSPRARGRKDPSFLKISRWDMSWGFRRGHPFLEGSGYVGDQKSGLIRLRHEIKKGMQDHTYVSAENVCMEDLSLLKMMLDAKHPWFQVLESSVPLTGTLQGGDQWRFNIKIGTGSIPGIPAMVKKGACSGAIDQGYLSFRDLSLDLGSEGLYHFIGQWSPDASGGWSVEGETSMKRPATRYWMPVIKACIQDSQQEPFIFKGQCLQWSTQGRHGVKPLKNQTQLYPLMIVFSSGSLYCQGVKLRIPTMKDPVAQGLKGCLTYTPQSWSVRVDEGYCALWMMRAIDLSWDRGTSCMTFKGRIQGPWNPLLSFLNARQTWSDFSQVSIDGQSDVTIQGQWPCVRSAQPIIHSAEGQIDDVHIGLAQTSAVWKNGKGTVHATADQVSFKGCAEWEDQPVQLRWIYDMHRKPFERHRVHVRGDVDVSMLKQWGYDPGVLWGQKASYRLLYAQQSQGVYGAVLRMDLTAAVLNLPCLGWFKLPGSAAKLHIKGTMTEEKVLITDALLTAPSLLIEGEGAFNLRTKMLDHITLHRFQSPGYDASLKIMPAPSEEGWVMKLSGEQWRWDPQHIQIWNDWRNRLPIKQVHIHLKNVWNGQVHLAQRIQGQASFQKGGLWQARFEAESDSNGHASFRVDPPTASSPELKATFTTNSIGPWMALMKKDHGWGQGHMYLEAHRLPQESRWIGYTHFRDCVVGETSLPFQLISSAFASTTHHASGTCLLLPRGGADFMYHRDEIHVGRGFFENNFVSLTFEGVSSRGGLSFQGQVIPSVQAGYPSSESMVHYTLTGSWVLPELSLMEAMPSQQPVSRAEQPMATPFAHQSMSPQSSQGLTLFDQEKGDASGPHIDPPLPQPSVEVVQNSSQ